MRSLVRRKSAVTSTFAALLTAGLLAACGGQEVGAAAVIGDRRISVADVQTAYTDVNPLVGQDARFTQANILNWLILEPYLTGEAAREGKAVSAAEAAQEFTKVEGATRDPSPAGIAVVRAILARGAITTDKSTPELTQLVDQLAAQLKAADVKINPRYGSGLDPTTAAIVDTPPNWLVQPEASATPPAPPAQ